MVVAAVGRLQALPILLRAKIVLHHRNSNAQS